MSEPIPPGSGKEPNLPAPFAWGSPSHIQAEFECRDLNEHFGLEVRAFDHPLQYKIDIWNDGHIYRMRLDGFSHLRWFAAETLQELVNELILIEVRDVIAVNRQMDKAMRQAMALQPELRINLMPVIPEWVIIEYFEAARKRTLAELEPLLQL
jgi:hypothetical protein